MSGRLPELAPEQRRLDRMVRYAFRGSDEDLGSLKLHFEIVGFGAWEATWDPFYCTLSRPVPELLAEGFANTMRRILDCVQPDLVERYGGRLKVVVRRDLSLAALADGYEPRAMDEPNCWIGFELAPAPGPAPKLPAPVGWRSWYLWMSDQYARDPYDEQPLKCRTPAPRPDGDSLPWVLRSLTFNVPWWGPVLRATVQPTLFGHAGIYAVRLLGHVVAQGSYLVSGEVELFGRVVEHEKGYRAEAARIRRLVVPAKIAARYPGLVDCLEQRYQCDVDVLEVWRVGKMALDDPQAFLDEVAPGWRASDYDPAICPICSREHGPSCPEARPAEPGTLLIRARHSEDIPEPEAEPEGPSGVLSIEDLSWKPATVLDLYQLRPAMPTLRPGLLASLLGVMGVR